MSTRLATILGVAGGAGQADDPLTRIRCREPTAGAEIRTKGALYLVVDVPAGDPRARRAGGEVLAGIERAYYHDLTGGISMTLRGAVVDAARRLRREHPPATDDADDTDDGIGVAALALHDREAHVVRSGSASVLVVRDGRMYEAARPGAPQRAVARDPETTEWHGAVRGGDRIALVGRTLARTVGAAELRRALLAHRPQAAAERIRGAHLSRGGSPSAAAIVALEVVEVPATDAAVALQPVGAPRYVERAEEPVWIAAVLARWVAAARRGAASAGAGARSAAATLLALVLSAAPRRAATYPTGTPRTAQRRAARRARAGVAGFAAIAVAAMAGGAAAGRPGATPGDAIPRAMSARAATSEAMGLLARAEQRVRGADLVERDPEAARAVLDDARAALARAVAAGVPATAVEAIGARVEAAVDRLERATRISSVGVVADLAAALGTVDGADMVAASDGSLWILEGAGGRVVRVDPASGDVSTVYRRGEAVAAGEVTAEAWAIATASTDVVVIDAARHAWRIDLAERVPRAMAVAGPTTLARAAGPTLITALQHQPPLETFALYAADGASGQLVRWVPPPVIPVTFPTAAEAYLTAAPDLDVRAARDLRVDASGWLLHAHTVTRVDFGTPLSQADYALERPPGAGTPDYRILDAAAVRGTELLFVYDAGSPRIVAFDRAYGGFVSQWRPVAGSAAEAALLDARGLVVLADTSGGVSAFVLTRDRVVRLALD